MNTGSISPRDILAPAVKISRATHPCVPASSWTLAWRGVTPGRFCRKGREALSCSLLHHIAIFMKHCLRIV